MGGHAKTVLRIGWLLACVALLVWFFASEASDIHVVFGYGLALLAFPIGVAVLWIWGAFALLLHNAFELDLPRAANGVLWALVVIAGDWQWFRLLPRLLARRRAGPAQP